MASSTPHRGRFPGPGRTPSPRPCYTRGTRTGSPDARPPMADQPGHPATVPATPPLVGRDRELAALREALAAALAGRGSLVLIGGEAGIGKTTLADALCRAATEEG